ncbi:hypothetical protein D3C86_1989720 [compost metagenome]
MLLHLALLIGKGFHRMFEKCRNDHLHLVTVIGDQLPQKRRWQKRIAGFGFLFNNYLRQNRMGDVFG